MQCTCLRKDQTFVPVASVNQGCTYTGCHCDPAPGGPCSPPVHLDRRAAGAVACRMPAFPPLLPADIQRLQEENGGHQLLYMPLPPYLYPTVLGPCVLSQSPLLSRRSAGVFPLPPASAGGG